MRALSDEVDITLTIVSMSRDGGPSTLTAATVARLWTMKSRVLSHSALGAYFQKAGMETIVFGPGGMAQMHQPNEYMEEAAVEQGLQFLDRVLDHLESAK